MELSTYADGDGSRCYPSRRTLAAHFSISIRTVQNLLNDLEALGVQRKVGIHGESGPAIRN
jgi:DNA-binding transcriptional regulator YhcF (GntR family)